MTLHHSQCLTWSRSLHRRLLKLSFRDSTGLGLDEWEPVALKASPNSALQELKCIGKSIKRSRAWLLKVIWQRVVLLLKPSLDTDL